MCFVDFESPAASHVIYSFTQRAILVESPSPVHLGVYRRNKKKLTSNRFMRVARLRGSGSVIAAKTDCSAEEGETETVPVKAATRGVVSSRARPSEYIHI